MGDDHSIDTVTKLTQQGFYGDVENNHAGVDAQLCNKLINHVHKYLQSFIDRDEDLDGILSDIGDVFVQAEDPYDDVDDEEEQQAGESDSDDDEEEDDEE